MFTVIYESTYLNYDLRTHDTRYVLHVSCMYFKGILLLSVAVILRFTEEDTRLQRGLDKRKKNTHFLENKGRACATH